MKFIHLADLHIGKKLKERSLSEDQQCALDFVIEQARTIRPDVVLIAGDVYDRAVPSGEAVRMLDGFLTQLTALDCRVIMIGGNHDSQDRLAFGRGMLEHSGLFISEDYRGEMQCVRVPDAYGEVDVWLLPHIVPQEVARFFEAPAPDVDGAVRAALRRAAIDPGRRNVLVTHQFVTQQGQSVELSDSEIHPVGGLSSVDVGAFDAFCYVALGHLHGAQRIGRDSVRYAGSPVRYSFSELHQKKSFVSGEIGPDGQVTVELMAIPQLHGMRELSGELSALIAPEHVRAGNRDDFLRVILTDSPPPIAPMDRLRAVFPNVLSLELQDGPGAQLPELFTGNEQKDPLDRFFEFYEQVTGRVISERAAACAKQSFNELRREADGL